ncbi:MAG TPA: alpha/beta hydrolase-fold protein [Bacteroidales bacterium]|nr:alpha/beta hydrolase-fold protein [Bacteroidales bacterium]
MKNKLTPISSTILLLAVCFISAHKATAQLVENSKPAVTNISQTNCPCILNDLSVVFKLKAPEAKKVQIDLGKLYDMKKDSQGIWSVTTTPQVPGFHYYSLVIDGVKVADPASETFYGMSRDASGIEIPESGVDFHEIKDVPHGSVDSKWYFSSKTNSWRRIFVYTPAGYSENTSSKYPVIYLQHGAGEDETGWVKQGRFDIIMDNLIAEKKAVPMIIVTTNEYTISDIGKGYNTESTNHFMDLFKDELIDVIIPFVEKNYRIIADREHRAIAGLSMGGGTSFRIGMLNPDKFAWVGAFSSSAFRGTNGNIFDAEKQIPGILTNPEKFNKQLKLLYISSGEQDHSFEYTKKTIETFKEKGLKLEYNYFPGAHEWHVWRKALHDFTPRLFK